jgi:hypothetical protein
MPFLASLHKQAGAMRPILPDVGVFIASKLGERWCWEGIQNKLLDASVVEAEIGSKKDEYSSLGAKTGPPKFRGA